MNRAQVKHLERELDFLNEEIRRYPYELGDDDFYRQWIWEGHSPFTNPYGYICSEGNRMLNIVEAVWLERLRMKDCQSFNQIMNGELHYQMIENLRNPYWDLE